MKCAFWVRALELLLGQGTQVNYLPGNGFREDSHPTLGALVLRGPSAQLVQSLKQRVLRAMVWRANEQRVWSGISYYLQLHNNQPFIDMGKLWLVNVLPTWTISRWAKGTRNWSWCGVWLLSSEQPGRGSRFWAGSGGPGKARSWCWSLTGLAAVEPGGGSKVA